MTIHLDGDWTGPAAVMGTEIPRRVLAEGSLASVAFESARLGRWDSALLLFLVALREESARCAMRLDDTGLPDAARQLLALVPVALSADPPSPPDPGFVTELGRRTLDGCAQCVAATEMLGAVVLRSAASVRGATLMRGVDLLACVRHAGQGALPIVALVNVLVGAILAFMGEVQLRKFGADLYVADLVGIAVVREMAPLMTAIVLCGRTGGAYAAELAAMKGSEETAALTVLGIPLEDYLVLPRVAALALTMPLLYLYGAALGIVGGAAVAMLTSPVPLVSFFEELRSGVSSAEVLFGFLKCIAFGVYIGLCGCGIGLAAERSSAAVGSAATRATVTGIVGVIAIDALIALCAHALDF